jgi:hypothetical protein
MHLSSMSLDGDSNRRTRVLLVQDITLSLMRYAFDYVASELECDVPNSFTVIDLELFLIRLFAA